MTTRFGSLAISALSRAPYSSAASTLWTEQGLGEQLGLGRWDLGLKWDAPNDDHETVIVVPEDLLGGLASLQDGLSGVERPVRR